jgi:hypothetical protein
MVKISIPVQGIPYIDSKYKVFIRSLYMLNPVLLILKGDGVLLNKKYKDKRLKQ